MKRMYTCKTCGKAGHNASTCPAVANLRFKHGTATEDDLVVVVTRILAAESGPIAHILQGDHGYLRVFPRNDVDPRAHLGIRAEDVPYFTSLPALSSWMTQEADRDGKGRMYHRPALLSLRGARKAFPHALFGTPELLPGVEAFQ